ncbi:50S ribosomal protein L1 [Striga asiatica]|uniref:50S ribosomal protein L1 n=1 Tax=Striga asiatica TaxID=4170 RepID=A0A5A7PMA1_STRAF|nr:50S ribosomal protein L1 [Striga asiatica]
MHNRHHRNGPGNGYRSNMMGMGGTASASRIPSENTFRGQRMYSPDHRSYTRGGYSSGSQSKHFHVPPPRSPDIFVEAGRLAAEYLVSKGVLPPSALSGKWPNDGLKNAANFQGFRPHEVEVHADSRGSVHSRLGNASPDMGSGRRKYNSEDSSVMGSRGSARERKRSGPMKSYGPDMNRDSGRSMSRSEKVIASVGHHGERPLAEKVDEGGTHNLSPGEITREVEAEACLGSGLEKSKISEDEKANDEKCSQLVHAADGEQVKNHEEIKEAGESEIKEGKNDEDSLQKHDESDVVKGEDDMVSEEDPIDLVKHSKFLNVSTRARSSLVGKNAKRYQEDNVDTNENVYKRDLPEGSGVHVIDVDIENSAGDAASCQNPEFKRHESDVPPVKGNRDVTERPLYKGPEADGGLSEFGRSNSVLVERGEKRAIEFSTDVKEDVKRLRQWVEPLSSPMENNSLLQEPRTSLNAQSTHLPDQKGLDVSIFQKDHADSCEFIEEKHSFKTCDLNLVGNSDVGENHNAGRMLVFPSLMQSGKEATPIDVDFSISNVGNVPNNNGKNAINANEIEVIDLEKDSAPEEKAFSNPDRRGDAVFTDLDGFSNTSHNANGIPDVQDGYGLMISELLGHDNPSCSLSNQTDLNSLHNHMDLPNTEGILGDDDSIYMSLGEIPISLLGPWEQPNQDYGKPF